jgi:hypothetical protein
MKYDFTAEYGPTTGRLGAVRNDEEELPIEPKVFHSSNFRLLQTNLWFSGHITHQYW